MEGLASSKLLFPLYKNTIIAQKKKRQCKSPMLRRSFLCARPPAQLLCYNRYPSESATSPGPDASPHLHCTEEETEAQKSPGAAPSRQPWAAERGLLDRSSAPGSEPLCRLPGKSSVLLFILNGSPCIRRRLRKHHSGLNLALGLPDDLLDAVTRMHAHVSHACSPVATPTPSTPFRRSSSALRLSTALQLDCGLGWPGECRGLCSRTRSPNNAPQSGPSLLPLTTNNSIPLQ